MHATHCLVGCMLCIVSISVAAATTSSESQDMNGGAVHAVLDSSAHGNGNASGELPDGSSNSSGSSDPSGYSMDPANPMSGGGDQDMPGTVPMQHGHVAHHVGWQSLLPGSIQ